MIISRKRYERDLRRTLDEIEFLKTEVNHNRRYTALLSTEIRNIRVELDSLRGGEVKDDGHEEAAAGSPDK